MSVLEHADIDAGSAVAETIDPGSRGATVRHDERSAGNLDDMCGPAPGPCLMAGSNELTMGLAYRAAKHYVAGRTLDETLPTVRRLVDAGLGVSLDVFGEGLDDESAASGVVDDYRATAKAISAIGGDVYLEIVPSHLGLDFGVDVCRGHVEQLLDVLPPGGRLEISAEESWRTPAIIELTLGLARAGAPLVARTSVGFCSLAFGRCLPVP